MAAIPHPARSRIMIRAGHPGDTGPTRPGGRERGHASAGVPVATLVAALLLIAVQSAGAVDPAKAGTLAAAASAGAADKAWEESAGLQAFAGDTLDPAARIFDSPDYQRQLLVPGEGDQAFVLSLKTRTYGLLPRTALTWTEKDQPLVDLASESPSGAFKSEEGVISIPAAPIEWTIRPEPPLIGSVSLEKLREAKPDYVQAAKRYQPELAAVQALKSAGEANVVVFFGTWCTFCKHYLPAFLKTLELAGNPKISVEFVGMSEDQAEPAAAIKKYSVTQTPTFIFLHGGKEVGRIEEEPDVSMEADMSAILK